MRTTKRCHTRGARLRPCRGNVAQSSSPPRFQQLRRYLRERAADHGARRPWSMVALPKRAVTVASSHPPFPTQSDGTGTAFPDLADVETFPPVKRVRATRYAPGMIRT